MWCKISLNFLSISAYRIRAYVPFVRTTMNYYPLFTFRYLRDYRTCFESFVVSLHSTARATTSGVLKCGLRQVSCIICLLWKYWETKKCYVRQIMHPPIFLLLFAMKSSLLLKKLFWCIWSHSYISNLTAWLNAMVNTHFGDLPTYTWRVCVSNACVRTYPAIFVVRSTHSTF